MSATTATASNPLEHYINLCTEYSWNKVNTPEVESFYKAHVKTTTTIIKNIATQILQNIKTAHELKAMVPSLRELDHIHLFASFRKDLDRRDQISTPELVMNAAPLERYMMMKLRKEVDAMIEAEDEIKTTIVVKTLDGEVSGEVKIKRNEFKALVKTLSRADKNAAVIFFGILPIYNLAKKTSSTNVQTAPVETPISSQSTYIEQYKVMLTTIKNAAEVMIAARNNYSGPPSDFTLHTDGNIRQAQAAISTLKELIVRQEAQASTTQNQEKKL